MYRQESHDRPFILRFFTRLFVIVILLVLVTVSLFAAFMVLTDYKPEETTAPMIDGTPGYGAAQLDTPYTAVTYHIGGGILGAAQDSFWEGGDNAAAESLEEVEANLSAVRRTLGKGYDFILLQEVDTDSGRSFHMDQSAALAEQFGEKYQHAFAIDYQIPFMPLPPTDPTGGVKSGLQVFSQVLLESVTRYRLDADVNMLLRPFLPDSCFVATVVPVEGGRNLILINVHFSGYGQSAAVQAQQMAQLNAFIEQQNARDYVIVGGAWNRGLPGTPTFPNGWKGETPGWAAKMPKEFASGSTQWAIDIQTPTRRALDNPYSEDKSFAAVTDGFLVSSNVEIVSVKTQNLGFRNSAHNPVVLEFILKG